MVKISGAAALYIARKPAEVGLFSGFGFIIQRSHNVYNV